MVFPAGGVPSKLSLLACSPLSAEKLLHRQAVHFAAVGGFSDIVDRLLAGGVPLGEVDINGDSLFHLAAAHNHVDLFLLLANIEAATWQKHRVSQYFKQISKYFNLFQ